MSKGTILYVGGFELPDKNAAAHRVLGNGKIFRDLGYNVVFIDVDKSLKFSTNILETYKNVQNFDCWSVPYPNSKIEWIEYLTNIDCIRFMTSKYNDVKVVVAYNYPAIALINLKKYCSNKNIKIIGDCTEWYSTKGTNLAFKVIKGLDSFYRMRIIQKKLDGLIVISKYLEKYYEECKSIVRLPPLVDIDEKKWEVNYYDKYEANELNNKLQLVYSGSPGRNKDKINYIIDVLYELREFKNYQMDIVGIDKTQFMKDYPEYTDKIEILDRRITFVGRVTHEESLMRLKNADFSFFLRDKTRLTMAGFPTKLVESISIGVPVFTNDTSDISEYIKTNTNGFIVSSVNSEEINSTMKELLNLGKEDIRDLKKNINKNEFDYRNYISELRAFLNSISIN